MSKFDPLRPGKETTEWAVSKFGAIIAGVAPVVAAVIAKYLDVEITANELRDLVIASIAVAGGIAAVYTHGRTAIKKDSK